MGLKQFISEAEACSLAGVSNATLSRFAEAGYLETEMESDGLKLYAKDDLTSVFGITGNIPNRPTTTQSMTDGSLARKPAPENIKDSPSIIQFPHQSVGNKSDTDKQSQKDIEVPESLQSPSESEPQPIQIYASDATGIIEGSLSDHESSRSSSDSDDAPQELAHATEITALKAENQKLQNITDIQEKILDMKDKELDELRDERDWLRKRVEKLEEKSDRDQLLLLSETQVLRQMITKESRSSLRTLLEWTGFLKPEDTRQSVLDHK